MKVVNIAVIGCGGIVKNVHVKNLVSIDRLHVKACMDINEETAASVASMCKADYYTTDLDRILQDDKINAVLIATLPETHTDISIKAAKAGKAIFCEKPVADTLENCLKLGTVLEETGAKYMVGYCYRFNHAVEHAFGHFIPDYSIPHVMAGGEGANAGILHNYLNNYCHAVDLVRFFHGSNPVSVTATGNEVLSDIQTAGGKMIANIRFENGSISTIATGMRCISPYFGKWFYKFCDSDHNVAEILNYRKSQVAGSLCSSYEDESSYFSGQRKELEIFVACVLEDLPIPITYEDGLWVALVMEATKIAFESGREVKIEELYKMPRT